VKLRATDGFWHHGRVVRPGDLLELDDDDALNAIGCGRAVALNPADLKRAREAHNTEVVRLLTRREPLRWWAH